MIIKYYTVNRLQTADTNPSPIGKEIQQSSTAIWVLQSGCQDWHCWRPNEVKRSHSACPDWPAPDGSMGNPTGLQGHLHNQPRYGSRSRKATDAAWSCARCSNSPSAWVVCLNGDRFRIAISRAKSQTWRCKCLATNKSKQQWNRGPIAQTWKGTWHMDLRQQDQEPKLHSPDQPGFIETRR